MILSKWPAFYIKVIVWVRTHERRPAHLSWGGDGGLDKIKPNKDNYKKDNMSDKDKRKSGIQLLVVLKINMGK